MPITVLGVASATKWTGALETEFYLRATWLGADSATQKKQITFYNCTFKHYEERMDATDIITRGRIMAQNMMVTTIPASGDTATSNW
jgi:hypothetical protein